MKILLSSVYICLIHRQAGYIKNKSSKLMFTFGEGGGVGRVGSTCNDT